LVKERLKLELRAFTPPVGEDEHLKVNKLVRIRLVARRNDTVHDKQFASWPHCPMAVPENA
jgi:hypothetical protein